MPPCSNKRRPLSQRWLDLCLWYDKVKLAHMHSKLCETPPKLCRTRQPTKNVGCLSFKEGPIPCNQGKCLEYDFYLLIGINNIDCLP